HRPPPSTLFPYTTLFRSGRPSGRRDHRPTTSARPQALARRRPLPRALLRRRLRPLRLRAPLLLPHALRSSGEPATRSPSLRSVLDRKSTRLNSSHRTISY